MFKNYLQRDSIEVIVLVLHMNNPNYILAFNIIKVILENRARCKPQEPLNMASTCTSQVKKKQKEHLPS